MWLLCPREMGASDNRVLSLPEERTLLHGTNRQSHPILCDDKPTVRPAGVMQSTPIPASYDNAGELWVSG